MAQAKEKDDGFRCNLTCLTGGRRRSCGFPVTRANSNGLARRRLARHAYRLPATVELRPRESQVDVLSRTFLTISAILLLALLGLRMGWPDYVVGQRAGYGLSIGWAFMLFLGLGLWRNLNLGFGSAGIVLVWFSTAVVAGGTSILLGLGFFDTAPTKQALEVFCMASSLVVFFAWWKIIRRSHRQ